MGFVWGLIWLKARGNRYNRRYERNVFLTIYSCKIVSVFSYALKMRKAFKISTFVSLILLVGLSLFPFPDVMAQESAPAQQSEMILDAAVEHQPKWIDDAIKMVEFIADNELILREDSYDEYEKLVLSAPTGEKLDRLYELLNDAMFISSKDVTDKYMPIYIAEIEKSGSVEHRQTLKVLQVATEGFANWTFKTSIKDLEDIASDESMHPFARVRALSIAGYLYGYTENTDHIVTTIQRMEAIAKTAPKNIFISKEIVSVKGFFSIHANDPEEVVKYSAEFLKLAYQTNSLIYGDVSAGNFTHLVMEYGDVASIDKIDVLNKRIAHMTGDRAAIFKAYTRCGESAVKLERNAKALTCFDAAANYSIQDSHAQIRYYLYSAIAYARDGQLEKARAHLANVNKIPDVQGSVYFTQNIDWTTSEVLQAEGEYTEAYNELRSYFNKRISSQKKELGEVTQSLREYSEEKAALLEERAEVLASKEGLQERVISRQRILIFLSALIAVILVGFIQAQRLYSRKLRLARKKAIAANHAIKFEARTDQLTRIGNRRAFYEYCADVSKNSELRNLSLAILDLDGFKLINDTYGHEVGDVMIQVTSQRLSQALKTEGRVFRLGGDEFALIFLSQDKEALDQFKDCIATALEDPVKTHSKSFDLNWSVGIVTIEGDTQDPLTFLSQADYALYKAKEQPGPSFHVFSAADLENINREAHLTEEVSWNLDTSSFTMFGQLIVNSANGIYRPFGVEALIRAQTRSGEVISPEDFVRHAISARKTSVLTKTTLLKAIEMLRVSGLDCPLLFNLSYQQITDETVLYDVNNVLKLVNFPTNRLIIECSERSLNRDMSSASKILNEFKRQGIGLALDDFGLASTGLSSLFDFDLVKTDRELLRSSIESARTKFLMTNLIDLSRKLNVPCIVKGVETSAEISFVKSIGGSVMQGFIFGRPEETPKIHHNLNSANRAALRGRLDSEDQDEKKLA